MASNMEYLRSDVATINFTSKGQMGEASAAIAPILQSFEEVNLSFLPKRISTTYLKQIKTEIEQLKKAGLKRVIRIADAHFTSKQNKNSLGFKRSTDSSREWRECEFTATVLDRYIDVGTGECVIERYDENATITLRQSRHIKASDQKKAKDSKAVIYSRDNYECPSCGSQIEHIADQTNCPFCGAYITFNFFDWQLDSFYLDMSKNALISEVKDVATKAAIGGVNFACAAATLLANSWDEKQERNRDKGPKYNNYLGAVIYIFVLIALLLFAVITAIPWYLKLGLGIVVAGLIVYGTIKILIKTDQKRKKKRIVRYSDEYLRTCIYNEVWENIETENLIDFSLDEIKIKSVKNTETTTTISVMATLIKKRLLSERKIDITIEDISMTLTRARYPERIKRKGEIFTEKTCPNCGANFEPDKNNCCSYCGYGLRVENYVWRKE